MWNVTIPPKGTVKLPENPDLARLRDLQVGFSVRISEIIQGRSEPVPRFFIDPSAVSGDTVTLTGENAHHASYSLRLAPGDRIKVCDQQTAYLCEMVSFDGETATARILFFAKSITRNAAVTTCTWCRSPSAKCPIGLFG